MTGKAESEPMTFESGTRTSDSREEAWSSEVRENLGCRWADSDRDFAHDPPNNHRVYGKRLPARRNSLQSMTSGVVAHANNMLASR